MIEYPHIDKEDKIEIDDKSDINSADILRIQQVEEEFQNHEQRLKAMIK